MNNFLQLATLSNTSNQATIKLNSDKPLAMSIITVEIREIELRRNKVIRERAIAGFRGYREGFFHSDRSVGGRHDCRRIKAPRSELRI